MNVRHLEDWLYKFLSDEWCGNETMPLDNDGFDYNEGGAAFVVRFNNDAHELWFGFPNEWRMSMTRRSFHAIMRWYLSRWTFGEWFGLKRWLWYKLLHRRVNRYRGLRDDIRSQQKRN